MLGGGGGSCHDGCMLIAMCLHVYRHYCQNQIVDVENVGIIYTVIQLLSYYRSLDLNIIEKWTWDL